MRTRVKKWGNSASVRIPAPSLAAACLRVDQDVDIREEDGRIIIEPATSPAFDLEVLLSGMTPDTFHDDADFGPPLGKEIW